MPSARRRLRPRHPRIWQTGERAASGCAPSCGRSSSGGLASAIIFRYDPRRGIVVQREVKHAPWKGQHPTQGGDRTGTIGIAAVSAAWVETKTLSFIEAVLKAN